MHFYSEQGDAESFRAALFVCGTLATNNPSTAITIAVPAMGNLQGIVSEVLGDRITDAFERRGYFQLPGATLRLYPATKLVPPSRRGPVIAAFTTIDHVRELDKSPYVTDIVFVPRHDEEVAQFLAQFPSAISLNDLNPCIFQQTA